MVPVSDPIQVSGQAAIANMQSALVQIGVISSGVLALDALITTLQNSPGAITPADQATLDQMTTISAQVVAALGAVNVAAPSTTAPGTPGTGPIPPAPTQASVKGNIPVTGGPVPLKTS